MAILLTDMVATFNPADLQFFELPIWVRIYNVPFRGRSNADNVRMLGEKIGVFMEANKSDNFGLEKSIRIKVRLDVRKP